MQRHDDDTANPDRTDPVLDYETKDSYTVLITATDAQDPGRRTTATVVVKLENQNEAPYFDKESRDKVQAYTEATGAIATTTLRCTRRTAGLQWSPLAAIEPDGDELSRGSSLVQDASDFIIEDIADGSGTRDRVELKFKRPARLRGRQGAVQLVVTDGAVGDTYTVTRQSNGGNGLCSRDGPAKAATLNVVVASDQC